MGLRLGFRFEAGVNARCPGARAVYVKPTAAVCGMKPLLSADIGLYVKLAKWEPIDGTVRKCGASPADFACTAGCEYVKAGR
jgi:hypothetical protein